MVYGLAALVVVLVLGSMISNWKHPKRNGERGLNQTAKNVEKSPQCDAIVTRGYLLTKAESFFYSQAIKVLSDELVLCPKVRMEDVIQSSNNNPSVRGRIRARHFDFVLASRHDLKIQAVIELDDKTHRNTKALEQDEMKDRFLAEAGIPIFRFKTSNSYPHNELREKFESVTRKAA